MKNLLKKGIYVSMAATSAISGLAATNSFAKDVASVKEYSVPVKLKRVDSEEKESMGNKALKPIATVVEKEGKAETGWERKTMCRDFRRRLCFRRR